MPGFNRLWVLIGLLGAVGLEGCGAAGPRARAGPGGGSARGRESFVVRYRGDVAPIQRVIQAPLESVWAALPQAFTALGYPGAPSTSPDEYLYLTPYLLVHDQLYEGELNSVYFDCGRNPTGPVVADSWSITFAILVRLRPENEASTLVDILVDGSAMDRVLRAKSQSCAGTGRLETALFELIEARVRSPAR